MGGISAAAPPLYRLIRGVFAVIGWLLFRIEVQGLENLPRDDHGRVNGGWISCGLPHRTWVEPFVLMFILPSRPRIAMLGEGPTAVGSPWRRFLAARVGGIIPIWTRDGVHGFRAIAGAAQQVVDAGAVFAMFPETGRPARPPEFRKVSPGIAYLARYTRASVVPIVFGGTHELYLRRRIVVRVLPPLDPPPADAAPDGLDAYITTLVSIARPVAEEAHRRAEAGSPRLKIARFLTGPYPRAD